MASRVNTRFVVILVVAVLGLLGLLILAYSYAYKSPAELMAKGDEFMSQGDFKQAQQAYSQAVYKDPTNTENLVKWIGSLEKLTPETETDYRDKFYGDYMNALRTTATIQRRDIDAHEHYLGLMYKIMSAQYSRAQADRNIEDTTRALAFFDSGATASTDEAQPWERLKRYRGLAIFEIAKRGGVISDDQYQLGIDDLQRAVGANPEDTESIIGLMNLRTLLAKKNSPAHDDTAKTQSLEANLATVNDYLSGHPQDAQMRLQKLLLNADLDRTRIMATVAPKDQADAIETAYAGYRQRLGQIADQLLDGQSDQLSLDVLRLYALLEGAIDPQAKLAGTRRMIDRMIDKDKANAELYWIAGSVARDAGDSEEALGWFSRIHELKTKPLSFEGINQFEIQRRSQLAQAEIKVDDAERLTGSGTQAQVDQALAEARSYRAAYASSVSEDSLPLTLLDGKIARVEGRTEEALRLFKKFNDQTQRNNPEGLWYEGLTASQLGQFGVARTALTEMIPLDNSSRKLMGMITLAQIQTRLKDYDAAAQLYRDALAVNPSIQPAIDGLDAINKILKPELNEDPVVAAIYTARQMRTGDADKPGDYAGAVQYLRTKADELHYDPRISRELASLLLDSNDIDGARAVIASAIQNNPDDEGLNRMASAMKSSDTTDILIEMIEQSDRSRLDKLLTIAQIAGDRGRGDLLTSTIEELNKIDPSNKRVVELTFIDALRRGDLEKARSLTNTSDLTPPEKLSFQARIAAVEQKPDQAIALLKQAAASGTADASIFQMLGGLQRQTGNYTEALQSYERALAIRPDNPQAITDYIVTLASNNQNEQALSTARRLQRYGTTDPAFMNLWLNLEALYGGDRGRDFAVKQREKMLELNPTDIENKFQLARLYITARQWDAARMLIDQMRAENDQLAIVELDASWYADQGSYQNRSGLEIANEVFAKYIAGLPKPVGTEPYIANAQFMLNRGRADLALVAANEAVEHESPDTMTGTKLLGNLYMQTNNFAQAVEAYRKVLAANADPDSVIRTRLIEALSRLERYDEAQEAYNALPQSEKNEMISMLQAAEIAQGLGESARANTILDQAVARYPKEPMVYIKRAQMLVGDPSMLNDLLSDIGRALSLDPNSWRAYRVRAAGYFAADRRDDALKDLRSAIRLNPNLDSSIYSVLNEMLHQTGRAGEAMAIAREVASKRGDDAGLMARIGKLFASYKEWSYAAEMYGMAWDKRHGIGDGAMYIDALVRKSPPDAAKANEIIKALGTRVGNINQSPGLLAAQALVLQARGEDEFAQQQMTKAFDLSLKSEMELLGWSGNLSRYFEGRPAKDQIAYLDLLSRRNTSPQIQSWLDLFIADRLTREDQVPQRAYDILTRLEEPGTNDAIRVRSFRLHGSAYFNRNDFPKAAEVWGQGAKAFPEDWELNNNLAYVMSAKLDRAEDALSYAQVAIDKNIQRSEPYETMAGIYIKLGKYDEARQMLKTGSGYIQSLQGRVTMLISAGRLEIAQGDTIGARSKLNDAREVLRSAPEAYPNLESDIEAFEDEINSANG